MNSPNIAHVALNPQGAIEMGIRPCDACHSGWAVYDNGTTGRVRSCEDTCPYWKLWQDKDEVHLLQTVASR